ncbi:MAG: hypothetical protein ACO3C1_11420 [Ilumatobacteraceae bacterium]
MDSNGHLPQTTDQVDIASSAFAKRLANLMVATRHERRLTVGGMARRSGGRFSKRDLRAWEAGERLLDESTVLQLTGLYGCDAQAILPARLPIVVEFGRISAGGVSAPFEPLSSTSLLEAYLRLVRSLRRQKSAPAVELRRDDIEILAHYLQEKGEIVVERLGALMGATRSQRTAMAGLFATGAVVIGLVGTAAAGGNSPDVGTGTPVPGSRVPTPTQATPPTLPALVETNTPVTVPVIVVTGDVGLPVAPPAATVSTGNDVTGAALTTGDGATGAAASASLGDSTSVSDSSGTVDVPLVDTDIPDTTVADPLVDVGAPPLP